MGREIPILMSGPLVRATLEGAKPEYARSYPAKTQTRRPIKCMSNREHYGKLLGDWGLSVPPHQYGDGDEKLWHWTGKQTPQAGDWVEEVQCDVDDSYMAPVKGLAAAGDRLWVRETWDWRDWQSMANRKVRIAYAADGAQVDTIAPCDWNPVVYNAARWHPSIHMPRWACRLVLPLVSVRVERVQDITEEDAEAEGVEQVGGSYREGFRAVWGSIYGTWDLNPWVWVAEWKEIEVSK